MSEATSPSRAAASVLFNLPEYRVIDAVDRPDGAREVSVEGVWDEAACPECGVLSGRVHQRIRQRLRDVPVGGPVEVVVFKRRFVCEQDRCSRRTFVEGTEPFPVAG